MFIPLYSIVLYFTVSGREEVPFSELWKEEIKDPFQGQLGNKTSSKLSL
jgi:hypothetical protein